MNVVNDLKEFRNKVLVQLCVKMKLIKAESSFITKGHEVISL